MICILDASAAIEIALNYPKADLFSDKIINADYSLAPDLYISEITNVIWKYHVFKKLPLNTCEKALEESMNLIDEFVKTEALYKEAFSLACIEHHSVYDVMYLVVARRYNGVLLTLDKDLIKTAEHLSIRAVKI